MARANNVERFGPLITPEEVDAVTRAFGQRLQSGQSEPEGLLSTPSAVATKLGTTQEEVLAILADVRHRSGRDQKPRFSQRNLNAFLGVGAILLFAINLISVSRSAALKANQPPAPIIAGDAVLQYDPYIKGYRRELSPMVDLTTQTTPVVDKTVIAPPQGVRVTLITPGEHQVIAGPPGTLPDRIASAARLRDSIRTLLAYEESKANVDNNVAVMPYELAPFDPGDSRFGADASVLGWHDVEVSDGRNSFRALFPDKRYAKDAAAYDQALKERLDWITDKKFFPSQHLYKLKSGALKISLHNPLPPGVELAVFDSEQTMYASAQSLASAKSYDVKVLKAQAMAALNELMAETVSLDFFQNRTLPRYILAVYPGGERRIGIPINRGVSQAATRLDDYARNYICDGVAGAVSAEGPLKPKGTITTRMGKR